MVVQGEGTEVEGGKEIEREREGGVDELISLLLSCPTTCLISRFLSPVRSGGDAFVQERWAGETDEAPERWAVETDEAPATN
jgi:hypothetical protein